MKFAYLSLTAAALLLAACGGKAEKKDKKAAKEVAAVQQTCRATSDAEIASLFDRWNAALRTGRPENVVATYAADSVLLPTLSNKVRYSKAEKKDYFEHFMAKAPVGEINERTIQIGCNSALDAGIYTFTFGKTGEKVTGRYSYTYQWDGKDWLISSHHSSLMPEHKKADAPAAPAAH